MIYIDGQRFGAYHILSAVGVDREGRKHILGIKGGTDLPSIGDLRRWAHR